MPQLQFVNFYGPEDDKKANRKVVRAHVMRVVRSQQKAAARSRGSPTNSSRSPSGPDSRTNHVVDDDDQVTNASHSPTSSSSHGGSPTSNSTDSSPRSLSSPVQSLVTFSPPSNQYATIPSMRSANDLIEIWTSHIEQGLPHNKNGLAVNPLRQGWLPAMQNSEAMFHATVFLSSAQLEILNNQPMGRVSLFHRGKAIKMINKSLTDDTLRTSNGTIGAIIALSTFELMSGNVTAMGGHLGGLREVVKIRKGLQIDGFPGYMLKIATMYDCLNNIYSNQRDCYSLSGHDATAKAPLPDMVQLFTLQDFGTLDVHISSQLAQLLLGIHNMAIAWDMSFIRGQVEHNAQCFKSGCEVLLRLLSLTRFPDLNRGYGVIDTSSEQDAVYESCIIATLLFCSHGNTATEALLTPSGVDTQSLKALMEKTDMLGYWGQYPGALIWCLIVGSVESRDDKVRVWFGLHLIRTLSGLAMFQWDAASHAFHFFVWLIKCAQKQSIVER